MVELFDEIRQKFLKIMINIFIPIMI